MVDGLWLMDEFQFFIPHFQFSKQRYYHPIKLISTINNHILCR